MIVFNLNSVYLHYVHHNNVGWSADPILKEDHLRVQNEAAVFIRFHLLSMSSWQQRIELKSLIELSLRCDILA